jgi:HK97 family phage major capsid protein
MPNPIPKLDAIRSMSAAELRAAIGAIDDELVSLYLDQDGSVRSDLTATDNDRADSLLNLRTRAEATMHAREQFERHPGSLQYSMGGGRDASDTRVQNDDGERPLVRLSDGKPAAVARSQSFQAHPVVAEHSRANETAEMAVVGMHGSLGGLLRAMTTTSGSAVVPQVWASSIIDRARNFSRVIEAGAQIVPMDAKTVNIGRLTGDPAAAFRNEGSTVTASDPVFDSVVLSAKTLSALVIGSMEWFQDSPNVDQVVSEAIAKAIALTIDQQALFGGLTTGGETGATAFNTTFPDPPNPTGVLPDLLANAASSVLGGAANGTNQTATTFWNEIIDVALQPTLFNETPNAILWSPTMAKFYAKTYDTTNQPMLRPSVLDQFQFLPTNQIPASFTQGTSTTNMSDVFAGDWTQLIIGQRLGLTVQTLVERYAELGQIGIIAHWRGDIALTRPRAFSVYRYLKSN